MNPGVPTGAIVAAAAKRAQQGVIDRLRAADALHASRACALDGLRHIESRMLSRFVDAGVVRRTGDRRYYLDEGKLADYQARHRERVRHVLLVLLVVVIVGLSVVALMLMTQ